MRLLRAAGRGLLHPAFQPEHLWKLITLGSSPYEETLYIDGDVLILSNSLASDLLQRSLRLADLVAPVDIARPAATREAALQQRRAIAKGAPFHSPPMYARGIPPLCSCMMAFRATASVQRLFRSAATRMLSQQDLHDPTWPDGSWPDGTGGTAAGKEGDARIAIRQGDQEALWFELAFGTPDERLRVTFLPEEYYCPALSPSAQSNALNALGKLDKPLTWTTMITSYRCHASHFHFLGGRSLHPLTITSEPRFLVAARFIQAATNLSLAAISATVATYRASPPLYFQQPHAASRRVSAALPTRTRHAHGSPLAVSPLAASPLPHAASVPRAPPYAPVSAYGGARGALNGGQSDGIAHDGSEAGISHRVEASTRKQFDLFMRGSITRFRDKTDFIALHQLARAFASQGSCSSRLTVLVGGLNEGYLAKRMLQACPQLTLHGFEILPIAHARSTRLLRGYPSVAVHRLGFSDVAGFAQVATTSDVSEMARIQTPTPAVGTKAVSMNAGLSRMPSESSRSGLVQTVTLAGFASERGLIRVDYVAIDVEGHEGSALAGMRLQEAGRTATFAALQYEVGGLWGGETDVARQNATELGRAWSASAAALIELQYELYMIGASESNCRLTKRDAYACDGSALYLRVPSARFFTRLAGHFEKLRLGAMRAGNGFSPSWNVLAMHRAHAHPVIVAHVDRHLVWNVSFV